MLSRKQFGRPKVLRGGEGHTDDLIRNLEATWKALTSRPAETRRSSVTIASLVLSASLRSTCKLMVFGRRTITKAKKQKAKGEKAKKQNGRNEGYCVEASSLFGNPITCSGWGELSKPFIVNLGWSGNSDCSTPLGIYSNVSLKIKGACLCCEHWE